MWLEFSHRDRRAGGHRRALDASPHRARCARTDRGHLHLQPGRRLPEHARPLCTATPRRWRPWSTPSRWSTRAPTRSSPATGFAELRTASAVGCATCASPTWAAPAGSPAACSRCTAGPADEHANVLLMDDDVLLEPEIAHPAHRVRHRTSHPTIVGGQMLHLLHPTHLHVAAENADLRAALVGHADARRAARGRPARAGRAAAADRTRSAGSTPTTTAGGPA